MDPTTGSMMAILVGSRPDRQAVATLVVSRARILLGQE
jgi:hypothetical protein